MTPDDWAFLIAHRPGRNGYMAKVDKIMKQKVEVKESKTKKEEARSMKSKKDIEILTSKNPLLLSSSTEIDENDAASEEEPVENCLNTEIKPLGRLQLQDSTAIFGI